MAALGRAQQLFAQKDRLQEVIKRGMSRDFGWKKAATAYEKLYVDTI